jgi:hypothetical protein
MTTETTIKEERRQAKLARRRIRDQARRDRQRLHGEYGREINNQSASQKIKMNITDWYHDELGNLCRKIWAR